jgi:hypothetical protein
MDSVQPVHSWNGSQITDGRRACSSAAATRGASAGDIPIAAAVVAQNRRKSRRATPCERRNSPSNGDDMTLSLNASVGAPGLAVLRGG